MAGGEEFELESQNTQIQLWLGCYGTLGVPAEILPPTKREGEILMGLTQKPTQHCQVQLSSN